MIIETQEDVTRAVLDEMHRTPSPRTRELLTLLVRHLHAFVREAKLTEKEFQEAIALVNSIGERTTPSGPNKGIRSSTLANAMRLPNSRS